MEHDTYQERDYWYKATILNMSMDSREAEESFHIKYMVDESEDEHVTKDRIRPYEPVRERDLIEVMIDDDYEIGKVRVVGNDGTFIVYVVDFEGEETIASDDGFRREAHETNNVIQTKVKSNFSIMPGSNIKDYLNPKLFEDPNILEDIGRRLQAGHLVVIQDAFISEFAETMHQELSKEDINWTLHESWSDSGFWYHHHNIYSDEDYTELMSDAYEMMDHPRHERIH